MRSSADLSRDHGDDHRVHLAIVLLSLFLTCHKCKKRRTCQHSQRNVRTDAGNTNVTLNQTAARKQDKKLLEFVKFVC